ncbi:MAG TPA: beta-propeller fold lactonase family protein, partial [Verrucomicrobiae bacterium]|nr:beta-propeller fold lactonase family protein [Verrucomicrobiae bacterium]
VTNFNSNTVSVIDSSTNTVKATINVGSNPIDLAYDPETHNMYVANENSNTVSVIDSSTNTVKYTINVGSGPFNGNNPVGISYNPYNNNMYVTSFNSNTVSVIDSSTNTVKVTIKVGNNPFGIAYNPYNHNIYVANENSNTVSVIDSSTNTVKATINVKKGPVSLVYNPYNHNMYVTNFGSNTVSVISPNLSAHSQSIQLPNTTMISITDASSNSIKNKSSTFSNSIIFSVTSIASFSSISGFECSLDGKAYYSCATFNSNNNNHNNNKNNDDNNSATIKYNDLEAGEEHTFKVRTIDSSGKVTSSPSVFTWIILTPKLVIQNLINSIDRMHVNFAAKTSLDSTLYQVQGLVDNHQNIADCTLFNSFIKKVDAFKISRQLSNIQALELKQLTALLLEGVGCHSSSTTQIQKHKITNDGNFSHSINKYNLSTKPLKQLLRDTVNNHENTLVSKDGSGNSMSNFNSFFNADGYVR